MGEDDKEFAHQYQVKINHQEKMRQKEQLHHMQEEERLLRQHHVEQLRFQEEQQKNQGEERSKFHQGVGSPMQR